VPDVDRLAAYLQDSLDELSKTAEERSGDTPAPA
jgi:hypothetical protein